MKNQLVQSLKVIVLALVLSLGLSFVFAQTWNPPSAGPSASTNTPGPINVGAASQDKDGSLSLGGSFFAALDSHFNQNLTVQNSVKIASLGINDSATSSSGSTRSLCISDNGTIILCTQAICGPSHMTFLPSAPTTGLCATGSTASPTPVNTNTTSPEFTWTCSNGPTQANCFANLLANCGSAQNGVFTSYPTTNLCSINNTPNSMGLNSSTGMINWNCKTPSNSQVACSAYSKVVNIDLVSTEVLSQIPGGSHRRFNFLANAFHSNLNGSSLYYEWKVLQADVNCQALAGSPVFQQTNGPISMTSGSTLNQLNGVELGKGNLYRAYVTVNFPYSNNLPAYKVTKDVCLDLLSGM